MVCAAGSLRRGDQASVSFPHRWTAGGVELTGSFTGAHLLHAAVAGCVLNDLYREAAGLGIELSGVAVTAWGGFDDAWGSTGIRYRVDLDTDADPAGQERLLEIVDAVAEIPRALRSPTSVSRVG